MPDSRLGSREERRKRREQEAAARMQRDWRRLMRWLVPSLLVTLVAMHGIRVIDSSPPLTTRKLVEDWFPFGEPPTDDEILFANRSQHMAWLVAHSKAEPDNPWQELVWPGEWRRLATDRGAAVAADIVRLDPSVEGLEVRELAVEPRSGEILVVRLHDDGSTSLERTPDARHPESASLRLRNETLLPVRVHVVGSRRSYLDGTPSVPDPRHFDWMKPGETGWLGGFVDLAEGDEPIRILWLPTRVLGAKHLEDLRVPRNGTLELQLPPEGHAEAREMSWLRRAWHAWEWT